MASTPNPSLLARIAAAYMQRERQRVGIPQQEQAAREAETLNLMRRAQAARIAQQMGMAPAEHESQLEARSAQADADRARAASLRQPEVPKAGTPHYATDGEGNVTAIVQQPDGSFARVPVGNVGKPLRPHAPSIAILPSPEGYVRVDRRGTGPATPVQGPGGGQLPLPPTTAQRNLAAGATAGQQNLRLAQQRATPILQDIGSRALALNKGGGGGFIDRVTGMGRSAASGIGMDPAVDLYRSGIRGFVPLFARAVGHVGILTEQDVARTEELFPRVGDAENVTLEKIQRVNRIMTGQEPLPFQWSQPEYDEAGITQPTDPTQPAAGGGFRVIGVEP